MVETKSEIEGKEPEAMMLIFHLFKVEVEI